MSTRSIVPRATGEGGIGTTLLRWATAFINAITCTTINALTLAAAAVGFTIAGGTTSKTLTVTADTALDEAVAMSGKATKTQGTWTPTITAGSGTITTSSGTGKYTKIDNVVHFMMVLTITTNGTGATSVVGTLPFTSLIDTGFSVVGRETGVTGNKLWGYNTGNTDIVDIGNFDGTYPGGDGRVIRVNGSYFVT